MDMQLVLLLLTWIWWFVEAALFLYHSFKSTVWQFIRVAVLLLLSVFLLFWLSGFITYPWIDYN